MPDLDAPIGIFDSGVGGLTVARAVIDQLPAERVIYVGDTAHGPYGPLPIAEIRRHALALGDALMDRGVKALVVACNSASAACLVDIRERYPVPVVEVILPAVRTPAAGRAAASHARPVDHVVEQLADLGPHAVAVRLQLIGVLGARLPLRLDQQHAGVGELAEDADHGDLLQMAGRGDLAAPCAAPSTCASTTNSSRPMSRGLRGSVL